MLIIGVTGGSGAGKTTVLREAQRRGALILDCDEIYHELLETSAKLRAEIENAFPGTVKDGALDRKKLGSIVFDDPAALKKLSALTHRHVKKEVRRRLKNADAPLATIDAIGLIESGLGKLCGATICVSAPVEARVRRIMAREGIPEDYARARIRARIRAQKPDSYFIAHCTHHIFNDYPSAQDFADAAGALLDQIIKGEQT